MPELNRWIPKPTQPAPVGGEQDITALNRYGWHDEECPQYPTWSDEHLASGQVPPCNCGFDGALKQAPTAQDVTHNADNELFLSSQVAELRRKLQDMMKVLEDDGLKESVAMECSNELELAFAEIIRAAIYNFTAAVIAKIKEGR
jgi:hypothetical protein